MPCINPQRAAVGRQLFDLENRQATARKKLFSSEKREIIEMLVVDCIELCLIHQPHQMGKLDCDYSMRLEKNLHTCDKVLHVWHLREHIVTKQQVGAPALSPHLARSSGSEKFDQCWHTPPNGHRGDIRCRFDPEHRNLFGNKILEEISIVTADFDDEACRAETKAPLHAICVVPGVCEPRVGVRGKICIVAKDTNRTDVFRKLDEKALAANVRDEWIEWLHLVELLGSQIALAQGGHA